MMGGIFGTRAFVAKHTSRSLPLSRSPSNQQSIICRGFPRGSPGAISLRSAHHPEGPPGRAASRDALRPARPDERSSRSHLARGQVGRARGGSREEGTVRFVVGRRGVAGWIARRRGRLARRRAGGGETRVRLRARPRAPGTARWRRTGPRCSSGTSARSSASARPGRRCRTVRPRAAGARARWRVFPFSRDRGRARPPPPPRLRRARARRSRARAAGRPLRAPRPPGTRAPRVAPRAPGPPGTDPRAIDPAGTTARARRRPRDRSQRASRGQKKRGPEHQGGRFLGENRSGAHRSGPRSVLSSRPPSFVRLPKNRA